ncbi:MAG TPA: hypothetical protein VFF11_00335, partial [Candidatus Binatia bacterium]|nr:hypothetical protein [Candidatus Binatia bacterium]
VKTGIASETPPTPACQGILPGSADSAGPVARQQRRQKQILVGTHLEHLELELKSRTGGAACPRPEGTFPFLVEYFSSKTADTFIEFYR